MTQDIDKIGRLAVKKKRAEDRLSSGRRSLDTLLQTKRLIESQIKAQLNTNMYNQRRILEADRGIE